LGLEAEFEAWFFLKNFDLANMLLLGLEGIDRGILEISACLPLDSLLVVIFLVGILLNCKDTYCLEVQLLPLAVSLFYPDS